MGDQVCMKKRIHIIVSGRVQGVFFRDYTKRAAQGLGLTGQVRNLPDGTVEIVAEGDTQPLEKLIDCCRQGSPGSDVKDVKAVERPIDRPLPPFRIDY
jgi:acylphosphatase